MNNFAKLVEKARKNHKRRPVNYIKLVLDESGSMRGIRESARNAFKNQVDTLTQEAANTNQKVDISTIRFNNVVQPAETNFNPANYKPDGGTALYDAVANAINTGIGQKRKDDGLLIVVVTDGQENYSKIYNLGAIRALIGRALADENISIVGNCPPGREHYLTDMGIPVYNVRPWEATDEGVADYLVRNDAGARGYFASRGGGQSVRASTQSYMANMDSVSPTTVQALTDLSTEFKRWRVSQNHEGTQISDFVKKQGFAFSVGNAFYELTKPEKVSAKKDLLILDQKTGALYGGEQARRKLGLPVGQDIRLRPGTHGEFTLFIESTSYNRKLVGNTTLLYRI